LNSFWNSEKLSYVVEMVKVLLQVDAWGALLSPWDELKDTIIPLPTGVDVDPVTK